jgi:hypothetical protein
MEDEVMSTELIEDGHRKVGLRFLVVRPDEVEVFKEGDWHAVKIEGWSNEKFSNFKLFYYKKAKKNVWQITISSSQVVVSSKDYKLLIEHYPDKVEWIIQKLMEHMNGEETNQQSAGD